MIRAARMAATCVGSLGGRVGADRRGGASRIWTRTVPAYLVTATDTTGAGDAFSAALAVRLAEGAALDEDVEFACAAGAYSVQSAETVPSYATRPRLAALMERCPRRSAVGEE